ncbi:hypothetical protein ACFLSS_00345 [Bacteroidota bacterium]
MKKVLFYSPDFSLCYSLLIYLQDKFDVTSSTDFAVLKSLTDNTKFDLLIIDSEPNDKIEKLCTEIKTSSPKLKVVLTYVYDSKISEIEKRMRDCITAVFYKPFDLTDITNSLPGIIPNTDFNAV